MEEPQRQENAQECPKCRGRGQIADITFPIVGTVIGLVMTWLGWSGLTQLLTFTRAKTIEATLFLSVIGPGTIIYSWWKLLWNDCPVCQGWGEIKEPNILPAPIADQDAGVVIDSDAPCHICKYNLRTQRVGGICPECGETILSPSKSKQKREAKSSLRIGLATTVAIPVALVACLYFFGEIGSLYFGGAMAAIWLILSAVDVSRKLFGNERSSKSNQK